MFRASRVLRAPFNRLSNNSSVSSKLKTSKNTKFDKVIGEFKNWNPIKDINVDNGSKLGGVIGGTVGISYGFYVGSKEYLKPYGSLMCIPIYTGSYCVGGIISGAMIGVSYPISVPMIIAMTPIYIYKKLTYVPPEYGLQWYEDDDDDL